ncbi:MAG: cation:proton antiporter [Candidatus Bipolaricaulia bacterium]
MGLDTLTLIAAGILAYGLVSARIGQTWLTAPMAFVAVGVGTHLLGLVAWDTSPHAVNLLAEITLVLVLFTDATRIDLRLLQREHNVPLRLLLIGIPLMVLFGTGTAALLFPELSPWQAAVLAAVLTPTDAALAQPVVNLNAIPARIRQTINVESGLNDGLMLPIVLILTTLAGADSANGSLASWIGLLVGQVTLGPLVGIAIGYGGGKLVQRSTQAGWMNHAFQDLSAVALSVLAFAVATQVGGNGFIAAFVAGLTLGNFARDVCTRIFEFGEAEGQLLTLIVFLVFGAVLLPESAGQINATMIIYAVLSLVLLRPLASALSLLGHGLRWPTVLFLGWFGPRGVASLLFAILVVQESAMPGQSFIMAAVAVAVLMSVVLHGISAHPLSRRYGSWLQRAEASAPQAETRSVEEMPTRTSSFSD